MLLISLSKFIKFICITFILGCFICSCSSVSEKQYIPKNATFVAIANPKSIVLNNFSFKEILNNLGSSDSASSKVDSTQKMIDNIMNSGISLTDNIYIFTDSKLSKLSVVDSIGVFVLFVVKDAGKLEKQLQSSIKNRNPEIEKSQDNIRFVGNDKYLVGFNDKIGFLTYNKSASVVNQKNKLLGFFKLSKQEMLVETNRQFSDLCKKDYAISFWLDYTEILEISRKQTTALSGNQFPYSFKNASYSMGAEFEDGKFVLKGLYYAENTGTKTLQLIMKDDVSKKQISDLVIANPLAILAFKIDPAACNQLIKDLGYVPQVNQMLTFVGLNCDDLFKMLDGSMTISVDKMNLAKGMPPVYGQIGIADTAIYNRFKAKLIGMQMLVDKDNYLSTNMLPNLTITNSVDNLRFTTDSLLRKQLTEKQTVFLDKTVKDKFEKGSFYMYFSIPGLPDYPSEELTVFKKNFSYLNMIISQKNEQESSFDIIFGTSKPDENSLKTIINVSKELNIIRSRKKALIEQQIINSVDPNANNYTRDTSSASAN